MPGWVRVGIVVAVTAVWAAYMVVTLASGHTPDAVVWAVPGVTWAAVVGGGSGKRIKVVVEDDAKPDEAKS